MVAVRLPSGSVVKVETMDAGPADSGDGVTSVGLKDDLHHDKALDSVGETAALVWRQVAKASPSKATVQLKMGFTVETGKLTALGVGGKSDAVLTETMEWSGSLAVQDAEEDGTGAAGNG